MELVPTRTFTPRWKAAALTLGLLAIAPFFVAGAAASAFRVLLGAGAIGLIAFAVASARKRSQAEAPEVTVRVITRSALGPRTQIAVVEFDGKHLLVGFGDGFAHVLSTSRATRKRSLKGVTP